MTEPQKPNEAQEALERLLSRLSAVGVDRNEVLLALTAHADMAFFSRYKPVIEQMMRAALDQALAARPQQAQPQPQQPQAQAASLVDLMNGTQPGGKVIVAEQVPQGQASPPAGGIAQLNQLAPLVESIARAYATFKQSAAPASATAIDAMRPAFEMFSAFLEFQRSTEARVIAGMRARGVPVPVEPGPAQPQQPSQSAPSSSIPSEVDRMAKTTLPHP